MGKDIESLERGCPPGQLKLSKIAPGNFVVWFTAQCHLRWSEYGYRPHETTAQQQNQQQTGIDSLRSKYWCTYECDEKTVGKPFCTAKLPEG